MDDVCRQLPQNFYVSTREPVAMHSSKAEYFKITVLPTVEQCRCLNSAAEEFKRMALVLRPLLAPKRTGRRAMVEAGMVRPRMKHKKENIPLLLSMSMG